jgi:hypothetical protein
MFMDSKYIGVAVAIAGGISSIFLALMIPIAYPEMIILFNPSVMLLIQRTIIIGGIVSIVGALFVLRDAKMGKRVIIVGSIISGINIITLVGAMIIKPEEF